MQTRIHPAVRTAIALAASVALPHLGTAAEPGENLLPNHDFVAQDAGYTLWYIDSKGQPLGFKDEVMKIEGDMLTISMGVAQPLKNGGLLMVEIPKEDLDPGTKYTFSFQAKSPGKERFMMLFPGHVIPGQYSGDVGNKGFSGTLEAEWKAISKDFVFDPKKKDDDGGYSIVFFLKDAREPISFKSLKLIDTNDSENG